MKGSVFFIINMIVINSFCLAEELRDFGLHFVAFVQTEGNRCFSRLFKCEFLCSWEVDLVSKLPFQLYDVIIIKVLI